MQITQLALEEAALKALADDVAGRLRDVRAAMQCELDDTGVRSVDATLPDGTKVGVVSRTVPRPRAALADEAAFTGWVREHAPGEIASRVVTEVRPAYRDALLAEMTRAGAAEVTDPDTGEIVTVPGVTMTAPRTASHSVRLTNEGRAAIAAAWRAGQLTGIGLPQLAAGGDSR